MNSSQLKIVISGAVGSGKTTLAHALGKKLALPVLPENMAALYQALGVYRQAMKMPNATKASKNDKAQLLMRCFADWVNERRALYTQHRGFIADRWEADLLDLWLKLFADLPCDDQTMQLLGDMRKKAEQFDCAVMLPPGTYQADTQNEDGLGRRQTANLTLLSTLVTGGLHRQCPGLVTLYLSPKVAALDDRVSAVLAFAHKHQKAQASMH